VGLLAALLNRPHAELLLLAVGFLRRLCVFAVGGSTPCHNHAGTCNTSETHVLLAMYKAQMLNGPYHQECTAQCQLSYAMHFYADNLQHAPGYLTCFSLVVTYCVCTCSCSQENKDRLAAIPGVVPQLVSLLAPGCGEALQTGALRLLHNLSFDGGLRQQMVQAGLVQQVGEL
jgi:hypothetical protein